MSMPEIVIEPGKLEIVVTMTFNAPRQAPFDSAYMQALYKVGYGLGRNGYAWSKTLPTPPQGTLR